MVTWSPRNTIIVAVLLSALVGSVTGLGASYLAHTSPTAQTRNFYLFAVDQSFNSSLATGLKADYDFSASVITVNRGDTLVIHFYNPTDQNHTFTMGAPYANRSEEHTSELQSLTNLVCRLLLEKKKYIQYKYL